jgi:hypothetical protein
MSDLIFSKLSSDRIFLKVYHPLTESHLVVGTKVKSLCEAESSELPVTEKISQGRQILSGWRICI